MTDDSCYRGWHLYLRTEEQTCLIVSPYGIMTSATTGPDAPTKAQGLVDALIEDYYPDGPLGRYPPPTTFGRKPGQPPRTTFFSGRQRLGDEEARIVCFREEDFVSNLRE